MEHNYASAIPTEQQREWLPVGTIIGNYVLRERIAASGIGEVYRADDRVNLRQAAIKILAAPLGYSEDC
jgi:hypothetical protein